MRAAKARLHVFERNSNKNSNNSRRNNSRWESKETLTVPEHSRTFGTRRTLVYAKCVFDSIELGGLRQPLGIFAGRILTLQLDTPINSRARSLRKIRQKRALSAGTPYTTIKYHHFFGCCDVCGGNLLPSAPLQSHSSSGSIIFTYRP